MNIKNCVKCDTIMNETLVHILSAHEKKKKKVQTPALGWYWKVDSLIKCDG